MSIERGRHYEEAACRHLEAQGLQCIARNVRYKFGEIDLVMCDAETLVFVEVRARTSAVAARFGGALGSIDARKQKRVWLAAQRYLLRYRSRVPQCRFDVVTFECGRIQWVRDAFDGEV